MAPGGWLPKVNDHIKPTGWQALQSPQLERGIGVVSGGFQRVDLQHNKTLEKVSLGLTYICAGVAFSPGKIAAAMKGMGSGSLALESFPTVGEIYSAHREPIDARALMGIHTALGVVVSVAVGTYNLFQLLAPLPGDPRKSWDLGTLIFAAVVAPVRAGAGIQFCHTFSVKPQWGWGEASGRGGSAW